MCSPLMFVAICSQLLKSLVLFLGLFLENSNLMGSKLAQ